MLNAFSLVLACSVAGLLGLCLPSSAEAGPLRCGRGGCGPAAVQSAVGGERPVLGAVRNGGRRVLHRVTHPFGCR